MTTTETIERLRWPDGRRCGHCGSGDTVVASNRKPLPYRCRDCGRYFTWQTATLLHNLNNAEDWWGVAHAMVAGETTTTCLVDATGLDARRARAIGCAIVYFATGLKLPAPTRRGFGQGYVFPRMPFETGEELFAVLLRPRRTAETALAYMRSPRNTAVLRAERGDAFAAGEE